ncbi:MAG: hypothetical protein J6Y51_04555 [Bacteroidaceae bacterium]|nr:hypothetical protein [Bacteroidaceae bacterium]
MKKKKNYESPTTQVVEMKTEKILCDSGILSLMSAFGDSFTTPFAGGEDW